MSDGKVVFDTQLNLKKLEKDYSRAVKKLERLENDLNAKNEKKTALSDQLEEASSQADAARERVKALKRELANINAATSQEIADRDPEGHINALLRKPAAEAELQEAEKTLVPLEKEADKLAAQYRAAEAAADSAAKKMENQKVIAAEISANIEETTAQIHEQEAAEKEVVDKTKEAAAAEKLRGVGTEETGKRLGNLKKRFASLAASALVFSVVTKGLTMMRDWLGEVVTKNDQTAAAIARLKGALLTMTQPLVDVVIPVFTALVNLLTAVIGKIAAFLSMLGGKTVQQSAAAAKALQNQGQAYEDVGDAAKEASKQLMGFDEINKLEDTSVSTDTGGSADGEIAPDFSWSEGVSETMEKLANWVMVIAAGLALWKIGTGLTGTLGLVATAIGKILAGVGFVALGFILLKTAFEDASENGMNLENTLTLIAGIIATGLGISIMAGSFIPLLVAAILSILTAIAALTGNGGALIDGLKQTFGGLIDFITGVFTGDWEKAWDGLVSAGRGAVNVLISIINSLIDLAVAGLNLIQIDIPDWVPLIGGKHFGINIQNSPQIPYLAQGAVIPPNREFMAVLGDQKYGTNIEAPEDLIRKIVREETAGLSGSDRLAQLLEILIDTVEGIEIGDETIGKAAARYSRSTARARGT